MYQITVKYVMDKCNTEDPYACESYLKEKLRNKYDNFELDSEFYHITFTTNNVYLDYVVDYTYGDELGDYGYVGYLDADALKKYRPLFDILNIEFKDEDLRKVVYCYYNCSESPDYYEIKNNFDF